MQILFVSYVGICTIIYCIQYTLYWLNILESKVQTVIQKSYIVVYEYTIIA